MKKKKERNERVSVRITKKQAMYTTIIRLHLELDFDWLNDWLTDELVSLGHWEEQNDRTNYNLKNKIADNRFCECGHYSRLNWI